MEPNAIDVALRQQIYFEALKEHEADKAEDLTDEIVAALLGVLVKFGFTSFESVPKSKLAELLSKANAALNKALATGSEKFVARLKEVLAVTVRVTRLNYGFITGKRVTVEAFDGSNGANKRLWQKLTRDIVPGVGHEPLRMLKDFTRSTLNSATVLVKRAFAEKWSVKQLLDAIRGTERLGYKDGLTRKVSNQFKTVARTLMQHIQAFVDFELGRVLYEKYQWVSTIDAVTTHVCRSRHLKVYSYKTGPRPPAHHNCRSKIVGIAGDLSNQSPRTLYEWLKRQPKALLSDILTKREAEAIATGTAKAADYPGFRSTKRLTPAAFGRKVAMMQLSDN